MRARLLLALTLLAAGCGYRPARFADVPVVSRVADNAPIPLPSVVGYDEDVYLSEVYIQVPAVDVLDPNRIPRAGDVNALDQVPASSWFEPEPSRLALDGPPQLPLVPVAAEPMLGKGLVVHDARGLRYELRRDPVDRPEMKTGAAALASRLVQAFGLRTPEVHVMYVTLEHFQHGEDIEPFLALESFLYAGPAAGPKGFRISATRWPPGIDRGITPPFGRRSDDSNDQVAHRDRRTLRALKVLGAWLKLDHFAPTKTRDVYVGTPPMGYLQHYLVGLEDALGAGAVVRPHSGVGLRTDLGAGPLKNFATLGLWPSPKSLITQRELPAIGAITAQLDPDAYSAPIPYAAMQRLLPDDGYWAAKRIAGIDEHAIDKALQEALYTDASAHRRMREIVLARRHDVVGHWMSKVTPCEVESASPDRVRIRNEALALGFAPAEPVRYHVRLLDDRGRILEGHTALTTDSTSITVGLPRHGFEHSDRLIVQVRVVDNGRERPPFEAHFAPSADGARLVGVVH